MAATGDLSSVVFERDDGGSERTNFRNPDGADDDSEEPASTGSGAGRGTGARKPNRPFTKLVFTPLWSNLPEVEHERKLTALAEAEFGGHAMSNLGWRRQQKKKRADGTIRQVLYCAHQSDSGCKFRLEVSQQPHGPLKIPPPS